MKRYTIFLISIILALVTANTASAAEKQITVILDGQKQLYDQPPIKQNGSTMVPLRGIFEAMGAEIEVEGKQITAAKGLIVIEHTIGEDTSIVNGKIVKMAQPSIVKSGRTLVPLRFIGEALGAGVDWHGPTSTVYVFSNPDVLEHAQPHYGKSPTMLTDNLAEAYMANDLQTLEGLLAAGATHKYMFTSWAAATRNNQVVKLMLDYGSDVHSYDDLGRTPLFYAVTPELEFRDANGKLLNETEEQDLELIDILLKHGADVNNLGTKPGLGLALRGPVSVGHIATVKVLLEAGAVIDPRSNTEYPVLFQAIFDQLRDPQRDYEMVKLLLDAGANANTTFLHSGFGKLSALAYASIEFNVASEYDEDGVIIASIPVKTDPKTIALLIERGADPNDTKAMEFARQSGDWAVIQILTEAGAK